MVGHVFCGPARGEPVLYLAIGGMAGKKRHVSRDKRPTLRQAVGLYSRRVSRRRQDIPVASTNTMVKVLFCTLALCAVAAARPQGPFGNLVNRPPSSVAGTGLAQAQAGMQTTDSLAQIDLVRLEAILQAILDVNKRALDTTDDVAKESLWSIAQEDGGEGARDGNRGYNGYRGLNGNRGNNNGNRGNNNGNRGSSSIPIQVLPVVVSPNSGSGPGQQNSGNNNADNVAVAVAGSNQGSGNDQ